MTLRARELMQERLGDVDAALSRGLTHRQLERELMELWGCSRATVRRYIRAGIRRLRIEWARARPNDERVRIVDELRAIAREARAAGEFGAAVRALDTQARIIGLSAPPTFKHHTHSIAPAAQPAQLVEVRPAGELAEAARALVAAGAPIDAEEEP